MTTTPPFQMKIHAILTNNTIQHQSQELGKTSTSNIFP